MKPWLAVIPQSLPLSFRLDRRVPLALGVLTLVMLIALVLNISQGEYFVPPIDVLKTVLGLPTSNSDYFFIVNTLRLPRSLVAMLVGIHLAIAGTILQGLVRNPLAEPGIIGINAGASLMAVGLIVLMPSIPMVWLPLAAFAGAFGVAVLIYLLSWQKNSSPLKLILVGVGLTAMISACTTLMITFGNIQNVSQALVWLTGSVYGRSWEQFWPLLPWTVVLIPLALGLARDLNTLTLGEDLARGLGSRIELQRGCLLVISVALAGSAVATAGTIGFVGLMAPHLARQIVGPSHEGLIPTAALVGGCIVITADWIGRSLFAPIELPCGVITAVIGAPYFLYLLYQTRNA